MNGFGLAYLRKEGGVTHPDDTVGYMGDDEAVYKDWLRAYIADGNRDRVEQEYCSRPHILKELIEEEANGKA